jgi:hypothetical protein
MRRLALLSAVTLVLGVTLTACDDDPFRIEWQLSPDTVLLYSLARPELNLPSAYSLNLRGPVSVESPGATGTWDFAVDTENGELVFLPPGALGVESRAAVAPMPSETFDGIREAPADTTLYIRDEAVPVVTSQLYVVQTGESPGAFGLQCVYYAKVEVLDADPAVGTVIFRFDASPVCNDRSLVPPGS